MKILDPGHSRSGHQDTSGDAHIRKGLNARHSYTERPITWKPSAIDIRNIIYEIPISRNFDIGDLRSGQFVTHLQYKSMGEK